MAALVVVLRISLVLICLFECTFAAPGKVSESQKIGSKVEFRNATFDDRINGTVKSGEEISYVFYYDFYCNQPWAVYICIGSIDAKDHTPLFVTVRESLHVTSWSVPMQFDVKSFKYTEICHTLCPLANYFKCGFEEGSQEIYIDLSTSSSSDVSFELLVSNFTSFIVETDTEVSLQLTPTEPKVLEYRMPEGVDSVLIEASSSMDSCMVLAIQDIHCPFHDSERTVEYKGFYQTMTLQSGITVTEKYFEEREVYIILILKPDDSECRNEEYIDKMNYPERNKSVTVKITPSLFDGEFSTAVGGAFGVYIAFYVFSFIICCFFYVKGMETGRTNGSGAPRISSRENQSRVRNFGWKKYPGKNPIHQIRQRWKTNSANCEDTQLQPIKTTDRAAVTQPPAYGTLNAVEDTYMQNQQPGAENRQPGAENRQPGAENRQPDAENQQPSAENGQLGAENRQPGAENPQPGAENPQPGAENPQPGAERPVEHISDLFGEDKQDLDKRARRYSWNLLTIAVFYALPVVQLVYINQKIVYLTGNQDLCYYNFLCSHKLWIFSDFNHIYSNMGYVMLGVLFLLLTWRREHLVGMASSNDDVKRNIPHHFGLFYAMGFALVTEGVMSASYHVCPNKANFQFDTAFMYVIAIMCLLKLYQSRHPDTTTESHHTWMILSVVLFIGVIGEVYNNTVFWVLFIIAHTIVALGVTAELYYVGRRPLDRQVFERIRDIFKCRNASHFSLTMHLVRVVILSSTLCLNFAFDLFGAIKQPDDFCSFLLAIFIGNLVLYMVYYTIMKGLFKERIGWIPIIYILLFFIFMITAGHFFFLANTSWEMTPALSREKNKHCVLLNFYDDHDIWHFLSSIGLFFLYMYLFTLDDDLENTLQTEMKAF